MALIFDSLTAARMLQSRGFTAEQAEGIADQMNRLLIQDLATKGDIGALRSEIDALRTELKGEIGALRTEFMGEIGALRTGLMGEIDTQRVSTTGEFALVRAEMRAMTSELTVKMYAVGLAVVGLVVAAQKLIP